MSSTEIATQFTMPPACRAGHPREPMEREEEAALAREARRGRYEARNALVEANLGFVAKIAGEYRNLGLPFEDLMNEGSLGLVEAACRYDVDRGARFITCAVWWIRKAILRALDEHAGLVRVPSTQRRRVRELRRVERDLAHRLRRAPRLEEVAQGLARSTEHVDRLRRSAYRERRLEERIARDSETTLAEVLPDRGAPGPETDLLREEIRCLVTEAVAELDPVERTVIRFRFGLDDEPRLVLKEIGEMIGVSRERVRQIETRAISRMRRHLSRARYTAASAPMVVRRVLESEGGAFERSA